MKHSVSEPHAAPTRVESPKPSAPVVVPARPARPTRCPDCGHLIEVFGSGGGERVARELGVEFLGRVPIDLKAREEADRGRPILLCDDRADISRAFLSIAESVAALMAADSPQDRSPLACI